MTTQQMALALRGDAERTKSLKSAIEAMRQPTSHFSCLKCGREVPANVARTAPQCPHCGADWPALDTNEEGQA